MLDWIFKRKRNPPRPAPTLAEKTSPPGSAPSATVVDWTAKLAQARGDDAMLALVRSAGMPLQFKQAAVEALDGEAALKLVEREFRSHDRRVHQLAKRRLLAKVAQRQTCEQATRLIETLRGLVGESDVPVNRCVELDHAWQELDVSAIKPAQRDEFAALAAQLAAHVRRRTDIELKRQRWRTDAVRAQRQLQAACAEAAAGTQERAWLASAIGAALGVLQALTPDEAGTPATDGDLADLTRALQIATALDGHLVVLDRLLCEPAETAPESANDTAGGPGTGDHPKADSGALDEADKEPAVTSRLIGDPEQKWLALASLPDTKLAALLQVRYARWKQARHDRESQRREQARERQRGQSVEQGAVLADGVARAEVALDAGKLAEAHRYLSDIDDERLSLDASDALRTRIAAAQARLAQLRGWQHWAGGRARDELVLQAEALAAATVAAGEANCEHKGGGASEIGAEVARLSIRQRADVITTLRGRWKEIDHLGGASGRALWRRFDTALKAAGEPVATHVAAQHAARETNLSARRQLLEVLEAMVVAAEAGPEELADLAGLSDDAAQPESKNKATTEIPVGVHALALALDRFHVEWRKLGPMEHTVPRPALAALTERMEAAVRRVEVPLRAARRRAGVEREALVSRARALAGGALGRDRDLVGEVRSLKSEWQLHAKALPLARADEQALWTDFKAAIDAAFTARDAHFSAREAEFEAHAATRAALIKRLQACYEDSPVVQRRTLAEVDAAWSQCRPAPRARAAALDAEYRAARDTLRQRLDDVTQRDWQATCDALDRKLALCLAREQAADADPAARAASWQELPVLPAPLEQALRRRVGLAPADDAKTALAVDDLLLQIETVWDLPTPRAFESARRERKLLAMKAALEGRRAGAPESLWPDAALAHLLGRSGLDAGQSARLGAILAAWRQRGPKRPGDGT